MRFAMKTAPSPAGPPSTPSILLVLMGSLGDLVRGLCLPADIKRNWPQTRITWLVEPAWQILVERHPLIDDVVVFDRPRQLAAVRDLRREMQRRRFDMALDLQRHFKSGVFTFLSGAPVRVGVHPRNAKEFNWLFNNRRLPYFNPRRPKLDHYRAFVTYLGGTLSETPDFGLCTPRICRLPDRLAAKLTRPYVVVVMGSSWVSKDWTEEGYRGLLRQLLARGGHRVVLVGDGSQVGTAAKMRVALDSQAVLDLTGRTSLPELTAILANAAAAVGPDSGPGHIAAAVGTPYVSLFGPTDPERVAPYACEALVVRAGTACTGCYRKSCRKPAGNCMAAITPAMVMPKLEQALRSGRLF